MLRSLQVMLALSAPLLAGCSSSSIYVPVTMPMEIDLRNSRTIAAAIYPHSDDASWQVSVVPADLTRAYIEPISGDARFQAVNLYSEPGRLPDLHSKTILTKNSLISLGEHSGADAIILGEVLQLEYNEDVISADVHRFQKTDGKQIVRKGLLRLRMHLRVIDVRSQKMIWNDIVEQSIKSETSAADAEPEAIDPVPLAYRAAEQAALEMLALTEKVTESVLVTFLTDADFPGVDAAIRKARRGDWVEALQRFEGIAAEAAGSPAEHKMLYNLGVAYQYNYDFRRAKDAFERAYKLKDSQRYLIAIKECLQMEQMYLESVKQQ